MVPMPTLRKSLLYMCVLFSLLSLHNPPPFCRNQLTQLSVANLFPTRSLSSYSFVVTPYTELLNVVMPFIVAPPDVTFKLPSMRTPPLISTAYTLFGLSIPTPTLPGI